LIRLPIHDTKAMSSVIIKNGKYTSLASISDKLRQESPEKLKIVPVGQVS